jgi:hypothetical protein
VSSVDQRRLLAVKLLHTVIWALFVACIVAAPILALTGQLLLASVLCGVVPVEGVVLLLNRGRCPLTNVAARYTADRRENFDIFLPEWLARHNKTIFTTLYVAGLAVVIGRWLL